MIGTNTAAHIGRCAVAGMAEWRTCASPSRRFARLTQLAESEDIDMSLYVDDDRRRDRSRSRDRRSRNDPPERPPYGDVREPSYVYPEDDLDSRYQPRETNQGGGVPYPVEGGIHQMLPGEDRLYNYEDYQPAKRVASPYRSSREKDERKSYPGAFPDDDQGPPQVVTAEPRESKLERRERKAREQEGDSGRRSRYSAAKDERVSEDERLKFLPAKYSVPSSPANDKPRDRPGRQDLDDDKFSFLPFKYKGRKDDDDSHSSGREDKLERRRRKKERDEDDLAYGKLSGPSRSERANSPQTYGSYLTGSQWEDRPSSKYPVDDPRRRALSPRPISSRPVSPAAEDPRRSARFEDYRDQDPRRSRPDVLTVDPSDRNRESSRDRRRDRSPNPAGLTVDTGHHERERSRDRRSTRDRSPQPPTGRMSTLTVDTGRPSNMSLAAAPPSPLLESYRGTYQDCSPMPSPLLLPSGHPSDDPRILEAISPIGSDNELDDKKRSRRARFHDAEDITTRLANALKGDGPPDKRVLTEILPSLTHEQVMNLRADYKSLVKTGSHRKGVNIAKHIRARLKDENPNLMKACYSVALGMWESESYWANFWYQGDKTRRELLIESLMGRTNEEIRQIKSAFTDKKYDNSLTKCMKTELKEDKFKKAVLMVLEERRMDDYDHNGRKIPLDYKLVDEDVHSLRQAIKAEKGGESLMISIVVQRSDNHLREVLKEYDHVYRANFARDSLKKSTNLVGELLAHILNGVINRPVRDALLLHHAISTSRKDELRHELLTSRLVRIHWDAAHMSAVRKAYRSRYERELQEAVAESTSGQWGAFCEELCIARVPNDVRRVERVSSRR
ncbi:Annexin A7-like protein [Emericellopsis cladophorae]|uniref:Annexin A7-like protein n=1 Tax=Emericellopsis cladophorae TaxID=2686198 RepID=A0A9Q0BB76_9HYPO|nr:Annexin A7-like protein [Emericellopsis cladophorae]KAI6778205.1 Annexin A7-like protein [Emericellopsis cladophorae]